MSARDRILGAVRAGLGGHDGGRGPDAIAAEAAVRARPTATTREAPKRVIRRPVTKLGAYMAMMCHCRPRLDDACGRPHRRIARGAAVMTKFISV